MIGQRITKPTSGHLMGEAETGGGDRRGASQQVSRPVDYPAATDEDISAYKRGLASGTLQAGSPNVVGSLIARIEQERDWRRSDADLTARATGK